MINLLLSAVGWLAGVLSAAVAAWALTRLVRAPRHATTGRRQWALADSGLWFTCLLFSTAAIAAFTALGVLGVLTGTVLACATFGGLILLARPWRWGEPGRASQTLRGARVNAVTGARNAGLDVLGAWTRITQPSPDTAPAAVAASSPATTAAVAAPALPARPQGVPVPPKASKIAPDRRARRAAARQGGTLPAEWGPVITSTADFHPEDDGELLDWMTRQIIGLAGWAEALVEFYDEATNGIGIDPRASAMLHDVADAAAQCSETMGGAKARFIEHYELPREYAGNGGLMTHDGRWVTGEDGA